MVSILHYVYHLPNNRATTSWRKLNTNLVYSWAPNPVYRLFLVPVCTEETSIVWLKDADAIMGSDGMKLSLNKRNTLQPIMFCIILARVKPAW